MQMSGPPSANEISGNGEVNLIWKRLSSSGLISSVSDSSFWPNPLRAPQRLMEATQSIDRTGSLSWNSNPSRSVKVQVSLSSLISWPWTICGFGVSDASMP